MLPPLLPGKICVITGGLTGIGRAIAVSLISHRACVAVNYLQSQNPSKDDELITTLRADALKALTARHADSTLDSVEQLPLMFVQGDISLPSTGQELVSEAIKRFGRIDVLVSNAGICRFAEFLDIEPSLLESHVSTNFSGSFYVVQAAARQMTQQSPQGGSIIAISSISALVGGAQQTHYTPTKAAILSLMQSTACALGKYSIRCNALLPGTIRTQLNDEDLKDGTAKKKYMEGRIPLGRLGAPDDLAGPAIFLANDELSGYVTGAALLVDGGLYVNLQ